MSKGLRNYTGPMLKRVVERRLKDNTKGLGYWAAYDYHNRKMLKEGKQHGATA